jgi:hypothetical protein
MADTPNHDYNVPQQGTQDWHNPLNENFEAFEVDIELRDSEANLGDYTPTDGAKFLATDTGVVYTGNGTTWVPQFVLPGYDDSTDEAQFGRPVVAPELDLGTLGGSITGGTALTTIAGNNLTIDSNGQLNVVGGGGNGIQSLTGGEGIGPNSIGDGDTLAVAWEDANDLDSDGNVSGGGGGGIQSLSGGDGISPDSISDGDTLAVAWEDADTLDSDGNVNDWSGAADLDASGSLTLSVVQSLSGGDGVAPGSIGDGDTLSVAWEDANDLDGDGNVTDQNWTTTNNLLTPSGGGIGGIDVGRVETTSLTVDGTPTLQLGATGTDNGDNTAGGNVIGGYEANGVQNSAVGATVGGGGSDGTTDFGGNIGERSNTNEVTGDYGTVGGGQNNRAGQHGVIGGGIDNTASGENATVSGGNGNTVDSPDATVGGGNSNGALEGGATVAGGLLNAASGKEAAIGGGTGNAAFSDQSTISGGASNRAGETFAAVGGGAGNEADGRSATIPGGVDNTASGKFSFAAGKRAKATNEGAFVWADSTDEDISSTGADQFLVEASGGTGIGTNDPQTTFHIRDSVAESGGDNIGRHVAAIQNTSTSSNPVPDVLGLELTNVTDPGGFNSYISFMDSSGTIGNIQGDGNGGVEFTGSTADFAEFFPKADSSHEFEDGTVVGLRDGEVVALAEESEPDAVMVVSTAPLMTGNRPMDEDDRDDYVKLSLVGQVPVQVSESVTAGDVLVASPDNDGSAVARAGCDTTDRPVVGMALENCAAGDRARTLVGGQGRDTTQTGETIAPETTDSESEKERLAALETENEALREEMAEKDRRIENLEAENEELRERLSAIEETLATIDSGGASPASADD